MNNCAADSLISFQSQHFSDNFSLCLRGSLSSATYTDIFRVDHLALDDPLLFLALGRTTSPAPTSLVTARSLCRVGVSWAFVHHPLCHICGYLHCSTHVWVVTLMRCYRITSDITGRHSFTENLLILWFLKCFCPFSQRLH